MLYSLKFGGLTLDELLKASEAVSDTIGSFASENREAVEESE